MYIEPIHHTSGDADEENKGTVKISGYIRGRPLSVNQLVFLPGVGEFQMSQIDGPTDPYSLKKKRVDKDNLCEMEEDIKVKIFRYFFYHATVTFT